MFIILFFSMFIFFSVFYLNLKYVKRTSVEERNLKALELKEAYNTIDEKILKPDLNKRINDFFHQGVDNYVIGKTKLSKREKMEKLVAKAYRKKKTYAEWEYDRILYTLLFVFIGVFAYLAVQEIMILAVFIALALIIYFYLESDLKSKAKKVDWENFIFFPDMLLSLCMMYKVGAVANIFAGFKKLTESYEHPLIDELKVAAREYDFNKDKYDILNDLKDSVDFKEFTSFINIVIESEKNNIPIVDSLTEFSFDISNKRKVLAQNQINKLPGKMEIAMLFTSMPICFIYMILPSVQMALQQMAEAGI